MAGYEKARVLTQSPNRAITSWLRAAMHDFRAIGFVAFLYGLGLFLLGWGIILLLWSFNFGWALLPILAGGMLVGPLAAIWPYRWSRRLQGGGGAGVASAGQVMLLGAILMVFTLAWIRAATLIFAIFFGLMPFAGFIETMLTLLSTPQGIAVIFVGSVFGGLFAALGFGISVFSIPMLVDREVDCFSAMGLSFRATLSNFPLMIRWAIVVLLLTGIGIATGLVGLIFIFPLLGFATWHAYCDVFKGDES